MHMPNDDGCEISFNTYGAFSNEISYIVNSYNEFDFIIGGDFHVDFHRPFRHFNILVQVIFREWRSLFNLTKTSQFSGTMFGEMQAVQRPTSVDLQIFQTEKHWAIKQAKRNTD